MRSNKGGIKVGTIVFVLIIAIVSGLVYLMFTNSNSPMQIAKIDETEKLAMSETKTTGDGWKYYTVDNDGEEVVYIVGYIGQEENVIIPKKMNDVDVKYIGFAEFVNKSIKKITIPKGILLYGSANTLDVFLNLECIDVESGHTKYESIDGVLFENDEFGTWLRTYPCAKANTSYEIPERNLWFERWLIFLKS